VRLFGFLPGLIFSSLLFAAPDEVVLGKKQGYPVCPLAFSWQIEEHCLVGTYSHYDEVAPARKVAKGAQVRPLKRAKKEPEIRYSGYASRGTLKDFLANNRNTGLLVMQGDTILAERYQYARKPEHRFYSMSMAKTVVGMLIGIAIFEKNISSVDDRADQYVPALKGHPYGETSIRHLLGMTSGVKFVERYQGNDDIAVLGRRVLDHEGQGGADAVMPFKERAAAPGERFNYASADTFVLGLVLRAATGRTLSDYLSEKIWQPMGAEADASWVVDQSGQEIAFAGVSATLRDWGRLGLLLAEGGARDGVQIIPADWLRAATAPGYPAPGYGYQVWLPAKDRFALLGLRGQAVYIHPATKTVVVHTAVHAGPGGNRADQEAIFNAVVSKLEQRP
jgi:CubicO group peptidase (beta-lactamase class C family)